jgi:hypothetical protein
MDDPYQHDKLTILNDVYHRTLKHDKPYVQPASIHTPLYPHQSTLVQGMELYRDKMIRGFLLGKQAINGKVGIVADGYGTGKTLALLSYLASYGSTFPTMTTELTPNSSKYFYSHDIHTITDASAANLIIVPHHLFGQWKQEIDRHTTMNYVAIETKRMIKGTTMVPLMKNASFVLTTNKCYRAVQDYATLHRIQWNNIMIDEASSIYINSSDTPLQFQFLWLIAANWIPLLFKTPSMNKATMYFSKDRVNLHPELEAWLVDPTFTSYDGTLVASSFLKDYLPFYHPRRSVTVLRNALSHIQESIPLVTPNTQRLSCKPHLTITSLTSYYLARNIEPHIKSKNIPHLFQSLSIPFLSLEAYQQHHPDHKHALIKRKIEEKECMICLEPCEYCTIVQCCYNVYCGKCLLQTTVMHSKCPTCREVLVPSRMACIESLEANQIILSQSKSEVCIDLIKSNKDGKFIIYSSFDNIYYQLFEEIDKLGLKAERIESNLFSLLKTVKRFKEGAINVLFVSQVDLIRGLSLPMTSHLIFYHELPVYELRQVLLHSTQRIGRTAPLQEVHLNSEIQV